MVADGADGVRDGANGWDLVDYTWNPKTGVGRYEYERRDEDTDVTEGRVIEKAQPYHPSHVGWYTR